MANKSYQKGYRFEDAIRNALGGREKVERSHQSGAYTGECDLKFTLRNGRVCKASCKIKADGYKGDYKELQTNDVFFKRSDRNVALVTMKLPLFLELIEIGDKIE